MIKSLTYIVSILFTYILGLISKKKGWHKIIPIPVQNLIIGVIVFVISLIVIRIFKENISIESIIDQIVVALGGSGTATLAYDAKQMNTKK